MLHSSSAASWRFYARKRSRSNTEVHPAHVLPQLQQHERYAVAVASNEKSAVACIHGLDSRPISGGYMHGNITLYTRGRNHHLYEVWSVV